MGVASSSNYHIRKTEIAKELGSVANQITVQVDLMRKGKNEHEKINGWENGKHVTCHSE